MVQLYSIYANSEEMNLIYTSKVGSIGQLKSSNCTGAIKSFLDKRRNKIPNCENCFAVQNDRLFRKFFARMRNIERAIQIKSNNMITTDDYMFLKNFIRDSKANENKQRLKSKIKSFIGAFIMVSK